MKPLSTMAHAAALAAFVAGIGCANAQDMPGANDVKCSFVCYFANGEPKAAADVAPPTAAVAEEAVATDRAPSSHRVRRRHAAAAAPVRKARGLPVHVARARAPTPARVAAPIVARPAPVAGLMPHPAPEPAASLDLGPSQVTSPVVALDGEPSPKPADMQARAETPSPAPFRDRSEAEAVAADLNLGADAESSGLSRFRPSWDWLVTQAHAVTVKSPSPFGDLEGVSRAF